MNKHTIKYVITTENFKYHFIKGVLKADGSIISKQTHPNTYVERFKDELKNHCKILEKPDGYHLRNNLRTGMLMAINLCSDKHISQFDDCEDGIVLNHNSQRDMAFADILKISNVLPSYEETLIRLKSHEYRLDKIERYKLDHDFFNRIGGIEWSKCENFVVNVLRTSGIINDFRRGDASLKEADIVVEPEERQIEIVTIMNDALKAIRYAKGTEEEISILDCVDIGNYSISDGVIKKFTRKDYTNKYKKELALLLVGGNEKSIGLINKLENILETVKIKNEYERYYLILIDIYSDKITLLDGNLRTMSIEEIEPHLYTKEIITISEINDEDSYLMSLTNIFTREKNMFYGTGTEIKEFIEGYKVWIN